MVIRPWKMMPYYIIICSPVGWFLLLTKHLLWVLKLAKPIKLCRNKLDCILLNTAPPSSELSAQFKGSTPPGCLRAQLGAAVPGVLPGAELPLRGETSRMPNRFVSYRQGEGQDKPRDLPKDMPSDSKSRIMTNGGNRGSFTYSSQVIANLIGINTNPHHWQA